MTAYADLDTSVIDELPPGRTPVTTVAIPDTRRTDIIDRVRHACMTEGRQAYWVCTLIEESELLEAQAAEATWEELKLALPELNVGLVHGRMKPAEKTGPSWRRLNKVSYTCWLPQPLLKSALMCLTPV